MELIDRIIDLINKLDYNFNQYHIGYKQYFNESFNSVMVFDNKEDLIQYLLNNKSMNRIVIIKDIILINTLYGRQ